MSRAAEWSGLLAASRLGYKESRRARAASLAAGARESGENP